MPHTELVGNIHIHSIASDGTGDIGEIASAAARSGLDFVIVTDHNTFQPKLEGLYNTVAVLIGQELHVADANHLLVIGGRRDLTPLAALPQDVIDAASADGALTFLAHPFERPGRVPPMRAIPWEDWAVMGYTGLELWNYMSEIKASLSSPLRTLAAAYAPACVISGPFAETLARWDELAQRRPVPVIGGSDAHAEWFSIGPLRRQVHPYKHLFRCVNTHILVSSEAPLGSLAELKRELYGALAAGHSFVAYDKLAGAKGFRFDLREGGAVVATMGDRAAWRPGLVIHATAPSHCRMRLIGNGQVIMESDGTELQFALMRPGVYRLEALRRFAGSLRGWIYSNPVYVS